jgi:hypothetical protein
MQVKLENMKKICVLIMFLLISRSIIFSQSYYHSGKFNIAGSASFSYSNYEPPYYADITEKQISVSPSVSYFLLKGLSAGLEFAYNYYEKSLDSGSYIEDINMYLTLGPVVKYYFLDRNISPFIKAGYLQSIYNMTESIYNTRKSFPGYSIKLGIGLNYFLTNSFSIETSLDYVYNEREYEIPQEGGPVFEKASKKSIELNIGTLFYF